MAKIYGLSNVSNATFYDTKEEKIVLKLETLPISVVTEIDDNEGEDE